MLGAWVAGWRGAVAGVGGWPAWCCCVDACCQVGGPFAKQSSQPSSSGATSTPLWQHPCRRRFAVLWLPPDLSSGPFFLFSAAVIQSQQTRENSSSSFPCTHALLLPTPRRYWGTSQPLFRGIGIFTDSGLLPLPHQPITTVVGAPIPVTRVDPREAGQEAFNAAVDALHVQYCAALQALFDAHKDAYAPNRRGELEIVG